MKLFVAIPIYNRKEYLEITVRSLFECSNIDKAQVFAFNDFSDEFDENYLKTLFNFPNAQVINRPQKIDIDIHYLRIMLDFLGSASDVLMICDADLLLRPDAIDFIFDNFSKTDGFLGLYNSELHRDLYSDGTFVYKEDVGFAGICVHRDILSAFLKNQDPKARAIDFKFSDFLLNSGIRIMVANNCLAQHIGFNGAHCNDISVEFSTKFTPISDFNKEIIDKLNPIALKMQASMIKHLLFGDKYRRHGFFVHQPLKYISRRARIKRLKKYYAARFPLEAKDEK
jgi:hypothetical protein